MLSFSQRKGLKPIKTIIQLDKADDHLRNELWNNIVAHYWPEVYRYNDDFSLRRHLIDIWKDYYGYRVDEVPYHDIDVINVIKKSIVFGPWHEMYDLIEAIPRLYKEDYKNINQKFSNQINVTLEKHISGYRFVNNIIVDITSEQELESIDLACKNKSQFLPVSLHLQRAIELLSDRIKPDYRNSIKNL